MVYRTVGSRDVRLVQLGVLCFSPPQDGDGGVGVLPERQEVLVGDTGSGSVTGETIGATELQICQSADDFVSHQTTMVKNLPKLRSSSLPSMCGQVGLSAKIHWAERNECVSSHFIWCGGRQDLDRLTRVLVSARSLQSNLGLYYRQRVGVNHRILRIALGQIVRQTSGPPGIACQSQSRRRDDLHALAARNGQGGSSHALRIHEVAQQR